MIFYPLFLIGLFVLELVYLKIADKYSIIDKPNERSSHTTPTIRGGGIIFILAALGYSLLNAFCYPYLISALVMVGVISFIDDIRGLPRRYRFLSHLIAIALLLLEANGLHLHWSILPLFIVLIGIVNAYNFMDGINGITGFYSLAVLLPFWYFEVDLQMKGFIAISILSLLVFLFFNARKRARCFAGDIGSIGMALIVLFVIINKILETGNWLYIFTLLIYGIDSIFTISQRLLQGENIFNAHRKHLYQVLANDYKLPHLSIGIGYALAQVLMNLVLFYFKLNAYAVLGFTLLFGLGYMLSKFLLLQNLNKSEMH